MIKKGLHILVIAVLALNLMGAWAFASALDCGMECCEPGEWAGTTSIEAASCCQMDDVTCGFETGQIKEIFDTAVCCHSGSGHHTVVSSALVNTIGINHVTQEPRFSDTAFSLPPPTDIPVYLSNASFLC